MKNQHFKLMYIDAFAGTGQVPLDRRDRENKQKSIEGSAARAVNIDNKPFDRLIFIEKDPKRCNQLKELKRKYPYRKIGIENAEANDFLQRFQENRTGWRGVLFLDPFATQVKWATIERIANLNTLDTWILFPLSAIARMLPRNRSPEDIPDAWQKRLTRVFGDENWKALYKVSPQLSLFGDLIIDRDPGTGGILRIYKCKLKELFGDRFLEESITLKNSRNSPLFEILFCVGHPKGVPLAKKIARNIIGIDGL